MSPLGERLIEFLRSRPDAAEVRDESTANARGQLETEGIECRYRGADYRVTVYRVPEMNRRRWYGKVHG